jgi:choline dehydrogenase-like flavoprotein
MKGVVAIVVAVAVPICPRMLTWVLSLLVAGSAAVAVVSTRTSMSAGWDRCPTCTKHVERTWQGLVRGCRDGPAVFAIAGLALAVRMRQALRPLIAQAGQVESRPRRGGYNELRARASSKLRRLGPDIEHGYSIMVSLMTPFSRGWLRLAGTTPGAHPVIDPGYHTDQRDVDIVIAGLRIARDIGAAPALAPWRGMEAWAPG